MKRNFIKVVWFLLLVCIQPSLQGQSAELWEEYRLPTYSSKYTLIDFQDSLHGWICTSDAKIIITNDGGLSWSKDSIPGILGRAGLMKMTDQEKGWIFTSERPGIHVIGYHRDTDHIWRKRIEIDTTNANIESGIAIINDSSLVYVTTKFISVNKAIASIYRVFNYGATIQLSDFDLTPGAGMYNSTVFVDDKNGWITMGDVYKSSVARTKDGGQTWSWERLNDYNIISDVRKFFSSKIGNSIQTLYVPDFYMYRCLFTNDGGNSFISSVSTLILDGIYYDKSNYVILSHGDKFVRNASDSTFIRKPYSATDSVKSPTALSLESTDPNSIWVLTNDNRLFKRKSIVTSVNNNDQSKILADNFLVSNNYPNPFNSSTTFTFEVKKKTHISVKVQNILGQEIAVLCNGDKDRGSYSIKWETKSQPSGIYFVIFSTDKNKTTKKVIFQK